MSCLYKRDIFNFYNVKDCSKCNMNLENREIVIGNNKIYLYYLRRCLQLDINLNYLFLKSKVAKLFLKDCILYGEDIIFLILEMYEFEKRMEEISLLLELNNDVHILII